jgi:hypothetical protein
VPVCALRASLQSSKYVTDQFDQSEKLLLPLLPATPQGGATLHDASLVISALPLQTG